MWIAWSDSNHEQKAEIKNRNHFFVHFIYIYINHFIHHDHLHHYDHYHQYHQNDHHHHPEWEFDNRHSCRRGNLVVGPSLCLPFLIIIIAMGSLIAFMIMMAAIRTIGPFERWWVIIIEDGDYKNMMEFSFFDLIIPAMIPVEDVVCWKRANPCLRWIWNSIPQAARSIVPRMISIVKHWK